MTTTWSVYFFSIAGFFVFLFFLKYGMFVHFILGLRLKRGDCELADEGLLPDYLKSFFYDYEEELLSLGFQRSHAQRTEGIFANDKEKKWSLVYVFPEKKTYASLSLTTQLEHLHPCSVEFVTVFEDRRSLLTVNGISHALVGDFADTVLVDPYAESIAGQWRSHLDALKRMQASPAVCLTQSEIVSYEKERLDSFIDNMEKRKTIRKGQNGYAFRFFAAFSLAWKFLKGRQKILEMLKKQKAAMGKSISIPLEVDVERFQRAARLTKKGELKWMGKTLMLMTSLILFALVFGFTLSFHFILIIIAALFVHELGHILGMYAFGYKDMKILFLPFLGAASVGKKDNAHACQKAVVCLMGPAPGIVIGIFCLFAYAWTNLGILQEAGIVFLVLNLFNLLPLMPFDGGQIFNLALLQRFPFLQAVFIILSAFLLMLGGILLGEHVLMLVSVILFISLPASFQNSRVLYRLRDSMKKGDSSMSPDDKEILMAIFRILREKPFAAIPFERKFHMAGHVLENARAHPASAGAAIVSLLLYFFVLLFLPLGVTVFFIVLNIFLQNIFCSLFI
ncbi:MAG: hypothetical protein JW928_02900 [Candidatus Aureabacteria bacterium]|nr:hypothetical protein [Candidatus Auribacterota bacterium]